MKSRVLYHKWNKKKKTRQKDRPLVLVSNTKKEVRSCIIMEPDYLRIYPSGSQRGTYYA